MNNPCSDPTGMSKTLTAARRNRYFYGKLLDVSHFQMEQDYGKLKRWLLNRLALGSGVLCGLDVFAKDSKLCVGAGVAIDKLGREIIVPGMFCIDPWALPDECGKPKEGLSRDVGHTIQLFICYRECVTDYMPVQVSDCNSKAACEAGTIVETFAFCIVEGKPEPVDPGVCALLHVDKETAAKTSDLPALIRQQLCAKLPHPCASDDENSCVLLAVVELLEGGKIGKIDTCGYRDVLYSNAMLFEMILCLAECCGGDGPAPTPTPTPTPAPTPTPTPTPTPKPKPPLQVKGVALLNRSGATLKTYSKPGDVPNVAVSDQPFSIRVDFTRALATSSVVTGNYTPVQNPKKFSFLVVSSSKRYTQPYVPGKITFPAANVAQFDFDMKDLPGFFAGEYKVALFGDPDPTPSIKRPAIAATDLSRLDGDTTPNFPSGNGFEGGEFDFSFVVG